MGEFRELGPCRGDIGGGGRGPDMVPAGGCWGGLTTGEGTGDLLLLVD